MPAFICITCGTQHAASKAPPTSCRICNDERQFVPVSGSGWTTLDALSQSHMNAWRELEPNLFSITTAPAFGIGQRALLLRTPQGNILWDCVSLVDRATVALIQAMGGLSAIAISHPHYYTSMVEWSRAFGGIPVHLHAADRKWISREDGALALWQGETKKLLSGATLICAGGHFPGGTMLHWQAGADGKGALLSADIVQVVADNKSVSFMWSYPNYIPLSAPAVESIVGKLEPCAFDRVHGAFDDRSIWSDGKGVIARSARRYLSVIRGDGSHELR